MSDICGETRELMIPYLNHLTEPDETGRFLAHIAECADCRKELAKTFSLHRQIKEALNPIPPDVISRAYGKIDFSEKRKSLGQQITDGIIEAVQAPLLELYPKLISSLLNPARKIINYNYILSLADN